MTTSPPTVPRRYPGRLLLLLGLALPPLAIVGYMVQFKILENLAMPWYVPASALLGVLLIVWSLWQARSLWRVVALVFVLLLGGVEVAFLQMMRLPAYTGPIAEGKPFPAFETLQSDEMTFTEKDLVGDQDTVMVFFRGRW